MSLNNNNSYPIGSMYGIYANIKGDIGGILMGSMLPYIAYMDPIGKSMDWFCWENLNRKP